MFKLYDTRSRPSYKGKFAFSSEKLDFEIKGLKINDEAQVCSSKNKQLWPTPLLTSSEMDVPLASTVKIDRTTTPFRTTTMKAPSGTCGVVKKVLTIGTNILPSNPGQFPWTVAIYRYFNDEEKTYYKCGGTIIDKFTVLTSVNCLLEDGLLLKNTELHVYVSPFSLSGRKQRSKLYKIDEFITHESYNYFLENNIAMIRLSRNIEFDDLTQPICLPDKSFSSKGKLGAVCVEP